MFRRVARPAYSPLRAGRCQLPAIRSPPDRTMASLPASAAGSDTTQHSRVNVVASSNLRQFERRLAVDGNLTQLLDRKLAYLVRQRRIVQIGRRLVALREGPVDEVGQRLSLVHIVHLRMDEQPREAGD